MDADTLRRRRVIRQWLAARPRSFSRDLPTYPVDFRALRPVDLDSVEFRRRRLPHWELEHSTYFVTFRVRRDRGRPFLVRHERGSHHDLRIPPAARLVEEAILFGYGSRYDLQAYVVMPDHVHLLLSPSRGWVLRRVIHGLKSVSALEVNRLLGRTGPLWQDESFDHLVRGDADWIDKRTYIVDNPVAAGLVAMAGEYPLSSAVTLDPPGRREALLRLLAA